MPDVVVVESPAKAKTINKYLGRDFTVLASFGHVRDLPPKDGSVRPEEDFAMDWESEDRGERQVNEIARALRGARRLFLATDPDREGEAISWHVREMLARKGALKGIEVNRITFNEITKRAVQHAIEHPRDLDAPLIDAYMARRALDYLVGFTLSPVLWRKLPGSRSAGRVQSVALRLIVDREMEIEAFRAREYWTVKALLATPRGDTFEARLVSLDGTRLDKFDLADAGAAARAVAAIEARHLTVDAVESKPATRNPTAPFMTSTLQQEASRKFGFGARQTMSAAQRLYEAGHITYMRTDGIDMAPEAVMAARDEGARDAGHADGTAGELPQADAAAGSARAAALAVDPVPGAPVVAFREVYFAYEDGEDVLHGIDFQVDRGQKIALVGESGGGKSTIVNLLLGLYEPRRGAIEVVGHPSADLPLDQLRARIGVVFQDASLFSGTIRENIAYGRPEASDEEVVEAARRANADTFIRRFEGGYEQVIGERGLKLSGGQRQRIAVARAILKDAPVLVLDEATSALDTKAELQVQKGLDELMAGRTSLIIAHRLSTIAEVDRIITLRDGHIDEIGSPAELAASGGIYAQLLALQSSGDSRKLAKFDITG